MSWFRKLFGGKGKVKAEEKPTASSNSPVTPAPVSEAQTDRECGDKNGVDSLVRQLKYYLACG